MSEHIHLKVERKSGIMKTGRAENPNVSLHFEENKNARTFIVTSRQMREDALRH